MIKKNRELGRQIEQLRIDIFNKYKHGAQAQMPEYVKASLTEYTNLKNKKYVTAKDAYSKSLLKLLKEFKIIKKIFIEKNSKAAISSFESSIANLTMPSLNHVSLD